MRVSRLRGGDKRPFAEGGLRILVGRLTRDPLVKENDEKGSLRSASRDPSCCLEVEMGGEAVGVKSAKHRWKQRGRTEGSKLQWADTGDGQRLGKAFWKAFWWPELPIRGFVNQVTVPSSTHPYCTYGVRSI